jgi:hypothetical protein
MSKMRRIKGKILFIEGVTMSKLLSAASAVLALSAVSASAVPVLVDFDDPGQTTGVFDPGTSFSGLLFNEDIQVGSTFSAPAPGHTGNYARQFGLPFGGPPTGSSVSGSFDGFTVSSLSFFVGDSGNDLDNFQLVGRDSGGSVIADTGVLSSQAAITVSIAAAGIATFDLIISDNVPADGGSSVFDNIAFDTETAVVPLPATLPLIGFGLAALGLVRRRKS